MAQSSNPGFKERVKSLATLNNAHKGMRFGQGVLMSIFRWVILLGVCYIILAPMIGMLANSFMSTSDLYNPLVFLIPRAFHPYNYITAFTHMLYIPTMVRTMAFALSITLLQVLVTSLVGYGFARFKWPGREVMFAIVIITILIPAQTYTVPLFMQFRFFSFLGFETNLVDSYWPIALLTATGMGLRAGLFIYIFRQFFRGLPKEIEEAALIDGAGQLRTYGIIMMPNAISAIVTVVMFSFVWQYNDTFYASLLMPSVNLMPTRLEAVGNIMRFAEDIRDPNVLSLYINAAIMLAIIPVLVFFVGLQRFFMESVERSGIVG